MKKCCGCKLTSSCAGCTLLVLGITSCIIAPISVEVLLPRLFRTQVETVLVMDEQSKFDDTLGKVAEHPLEWCFFNLTNARELLSTTPTA